MSVSVMSMDFKARRKATGWTRKELAARAGLDPRLIQLVELGQWSEFEALGRIEAVLKRKEQGEDDPWLKPPSKADGTDDA